MIQAELDSETPGSVEQASQSLISPRILILLRRIAVGCWAIAVIYWTHRDGVAFDRNTLLLYICTGLLAASIGRRQGLAVLRDWLPFAAVLLVYDLTRGAAALLGRPTEWHLQINADRWMFGGTEPTVWLQAHLKEPFPPWWEIGVSLVYVSFFFAPYLVAAALWLRDRRAWRQFVFQFVIISFIGLGVFIAFPAAPPWAAAQCTSADVVGGPSDPSCVSATVGTLRTGGMLGKVTPEHAGAAPYIERISSRGWNRLGFTEAKALLDEGQAGVNQVAAVPSLHAAISSLITVFFWPRVRKRWRPLLALYALAMGFALVYSAEHYVFDILLGWLLTGLVTYGFRRWEARRERRNQLPVAGVPNEVGRADILDGSLATRS
ncbi:MAG: phosphatase PAP2 family protein [Actinomycetota bacterium]|nr:phosphatase PAP2 family protein [Actinomycetota bacterium]MDQ2955743.1 phosphatase PAP2 family protein [Actinomycetota bacterium]